MAASSDCHRWSPHADFSASLGDQPFVSWHSMIKFFHPSATNTPRGHEEGELISGKVVLRLAQGVFLIVVGDLF